MCDPIYTLKDALQHLLKITPDVLLSDGTHIWSIDKLLDSLQFEDDMLRPSYLGMYANGKYYIRDIDGREDQVLPPRYNEVN